MEKGDVGGEKEEDESVKLELPASKDLADVPNKLVKPEANVVVEDADDHETDELEGIQVATQVTLLPVVQKMSRLSQEEFEK